MPSGNGKERPAKILSHGNASWQPSVPSSRSERVLGSWCLGITVTTDLALSTLAVGRNLLPRCLITVPIKGAGAWDQLMTTEMYTP